MDKETLIILMLLTLSVITIGFCIYVSKGVKVKSPNMSVRRLTVMNGGVTDLTAGKSCWCDNMMAACPSTSSTITIDPNVGGKIVHNDGTTWTITSISKGYSSGWSNPSITFTANGQTKSACLFGAGRLDFDSGDYWTSQSC